MVEAMPRLADPLWILESRRFLARMGVLLQCDRSRKREASCVPAFEAHFTWQVDPRITAVSRRLAVTSTRVG